MKIPRMFNTKKYQVYTIKCNKSGKIFVGLTSGTKANMLTWLLKNTEQDPNSYIKLKESIKEFGYQSHTFSRHANKVYDTKKEGEEYVARVQTELCKKELLLNDDIVNPETYTCGGCNKTLKVIYKKVHDEQYCTAHTVEFLDSLIA